MAKNNDMDLKRRIKDMEDKDREANPIAAASTVLEVKEANTVSFDQWWMMVAHKVKMRPHLKEILWADFNARGLSRNETEQKYDDTLRIFGVAW
jgi:hypothetical protein